MPRDTSIKLTDQPGNLQAALDAGFDTVVPIIPPGATLYPGGTWPDGSVIPPCTVDASQLGKIPGVLQGDSWNTRSGWTSYQITPDDIANHDAANASCGLLCGAGFVGVDLDALDADLAKAWFKVICDRWPDVQYRVGRYPKFAIPFRVSGDPIPPMQAKFTRDGEEQVQGIDILGTGRQMVLLGTHPATGHPYTWFQADTGGQVMPDAARCHELDQAGVEALLESLSEAAICLGWTKGQTSTGRATTGQRSELNDHPVDIALARDILAAMPNTLDGSEWYKLAYALQWDYGADGWPMFLEFSRKWKNGADSEKTIASKWNAGTGADGSISFGSMLIGMIERHPLPPELEARRRADAKERGQSAWTPIPMPPLDHCPTLPGPVYNPWEDMPDDVSDTKPDDRPKMWAGVEPLDVMQPVLAPKLPERCIPAILRPLMAYCQRAFKSDPV